MSQWINLTPHEVTIIGGGEPMVVPPSGTLARVAQTLTEVGTVRGVRIVRSTYGAVVGLPPQQHGCAYCGAINCECAAGNEGVCGCSGEPEYPATYIVSAMVRDAVPSRTDVFSPADFVRDAAGKIVGCKALEGNQ